MKTIPLLDEIARVLKKELHGRVINHGAIGGQVLDVRFEEEDRTKPLRLIFSIYMDDRRVDYPFTQKGIQGALEALKDWGIQALGK